MYSLPLEKPFIHITSFIPIKTIGKGGYSTVVLVRKKNDGQLYAMKIINKAFINERAKVAQMLTERKVLSETKCPFIVRLNYAF